MGYEQLSLSSFIKEMKEVTDGPHPRKFCFVLGAGASRTSGIKSGQELVRIWDKELQERNETEYRTWRSALGITDDNMSSFYSQYYEKRFQRCRTDGYNYIEKIMDSAKPSAGYVMLAHLLTKTPHNVIITTNFDHLTEDAVNYYAQSTPLVIGHEALAHYVSGQPVRPTIIKIHRDLLFDPKSRTEDLEKLPDSWKNALELIFANYHPVFIGYAGNDKSLMDFLVENSKKFAEDEWKFPYWMLYKTDKLEGKVKEFLEKSNGFYIFHSGFDEVMIQLGATFEYMIPSEDSFLGDAKKRYKALADAIDALSDGIKESNHIDNAIKDEAKLTIEVSDTDNPENERNKVNQAIAKIVSQSEMQRMYRDACAFYDDNKYPESVVLLEQLIKLDAENPRYYSRLGDAFYALDKNEEALVAYRKAANLEPVEGTHYLDIAKTLREMNRREDALVMYRKAAQYNQDEEIFHYILADEFEELDEYEDALAEYNKVVELDPIWRTARYHVAKMQFNLHQYEEAVDTIQRAIDYTGDYSLFYSVLSDALKALGRNAEATASYQKYEELIKKEKDNNT